MSQYANITCGVLTPCDVSAELSAKNVFELLAKHGWAMPTHYGNEEPIQEKYIGSHKKGRFGLGAENSIAAFI